MLVRLFLVIGLSLLLFSCGKNPNLEVEYNPEDYPPSLYPDYIIDGILENSDLEYDPDSFFPKGETTESPCYELTYLHTSPKAISLLQQLEGFHPSGYYDIKQTTIGFGTRKPAYIKGEISKIEGLILLSHELVKTEQVVKDNVTTCLSQGQFDSLVIFAFNVGHNGFKRSTLLKRVNQKEWHKVPEEFKRWVYAAGKVSKGLKNRRQEEINLWNT